MDERHNYYRILHVQGDAPLEIIKTSYRTLMQRMKMHPDLGGDHETAMRINEAYATLSDPQTRAEYDRLLKLRSTPREGRPDGERKSSRDNPARPANDDSKPRLSSNRCPFCDTEHQHRGDLKDVYCASCDSPLARVKLSKLKASDTYTNMDRAMERMPSALPLRFYLQKVPQTGVAGRMLDMSPGGIRFTTDEILPISSIIRIECIAFSAVAQVRYCRGHNPAQVGVEFLTVKFRTHTGTFVSLEA